MITNIISAMGNNNSIYPLIVRDCAIEAPCKIAMTYNQNKSDEFIAQNAIRERFIDEYGTSVIWLGGIPFVEKIADKLIKNKGFNSKVNLKLFGNDKNQNINLNIEKFRNTAPEAVKDLLKSKDNKNLYEKLLAIKFVSAVSIPVLLMGYVLPKINFAISKKKMEKRNENLTFGSNATSTIANFSTVDKMAMTDGGLTLGRVGTSRNKNEAMDNAFKMCGMLFLNFVAPKKIASILDTTMSKIFNINVNLDPIILTDKKFVEKIKNNTLILPEENENIIDFIDKNPQSLFVKYANKLKKIKMLNEKIRDPREFIDVKSLKNFQKDLKEFCDKAKQSNDIEKFVKKAKFVKSVNIITNVAISSFLLAIALPKVHFLLRKLVTGSDLEPGLIKK